MFFFTHVILVKYQRDLRLTISLDLRIPINILVYTFYLVFSEISKGSETISSDLRVPIDVLVYTFYLV